MFNMYSRRVSLIKCRIRSKNTKRQLKSKQISGNCIYWSCLYLHCVDNDHICVKLKEKLIVITRRH